MLSSGASVSGSSLLYCVIFVTPSLSVGSGMDCASLTIAGSGICGAVISAADVTAAVTVCSALSAEASSDEGLFAVSPSEAIGAAVVSVCLSAELSDTGRESFITAPAPTPSSTAAATAAAAVYFFLILIFTLLPAAALPSSSAAVSSSAQV